MSRSDVTPDQLAEAIARVRDWTITKGREYVDMDDVLAVCDAAERTAEAERKLELTQLDRDLHRAEHEKLRPLLAAAERRSGSQDDFAALVDDYDAACEERDAARAERDEARAMLREARKQLIWCSGSSDFAPGGIARDGWVNGPQPLIARLHAAVAELDKEAK